MKHICTDIHIIHLYVVNTYIVVIYTGDTYYVLTKSLTCGTYWLWNPSTGEFYDQHDTNCTLISIGCVFNARNVSCNDDTLMLHANLHD